MNNTDIIRRLVKAGLLNDGQIELTRLPGGVSSDIFTASDGVNSLVVKQALKKLTVAEEWHADTARNRVEREFMRYVKSFSPGSVPELLYDDPQHDFFGMEHLDDSFANWKTLLLDGSFEVETARKSAAFLAGLHLHSSGCRRAERLFRSNEHFISLRIDPYLITTGNRHPRLRKIFHGEANRLRNSKRALIHGDFSPKNILYGQDRIVVLDHEVACLSDPAFDVAFLLNHLCLKRLYHAGQARLLPDLASEFWQAYSVKSGSLDSKARASQTGRLLLLLMLARMDGTSPVEYLHEKQKNLVRRFVYRLLRREVFLPGEINRLWQNELKTHPSEN